MGVDGSVRPRFRSLSDPISTTLSLAANICLNRGITGWPHECPTRRVRSHTVIVARHARLYLAKTAPTPSASVPACAQIRGAAPLGRSAQALELTVTAPQLRGPHSEVLTSHSETTLRAVRQVGV